MKKLLLILLCTFSLFGCGVSSSDKKQMETKLFVFLLDKYRNTDIYTSNYSVTISSMNKEEYVYGGKYWGVFNCQFENGDDKVMMTGIASFDENMDIVRLNENYGKDKLAIDISSVFINSKDVSDVNHSKYVLDCFANRNNYSK